jgi:hypothetical protein
MPASRSNSGHLGVDLEQTAAAWQQDSVPKNSRQYTRCRNWQLWQHFKLQSLLLLLLLLLFQACHFLDSSPAAPDVAFDRR